MIQQGDRVKVPTQIKFNICYPARDGYVIRLDNAATILFSDGTRGRYQVETLQLIHLVNKEIIVEIPSLT